MTEQRSELGILGTMVGTVFPLAERTGLCTRRTGPKRFTRKVRFSYQGETNMEYRLLGSSGFSVPALSFGTGTFGGHGAFFAKWGNSGVAEARRLVDMCVEAGVNLFDTADVYSAGQAEEILGKAIGGRRDKLLISTKATFRMSDDPNDVGMSRYHLIRSCEDSLRRLNTDYIDIYTMHGFDAQTSVEETLRALDTLVQSGKVRYIACSNFSGWHLMKSLAVSEKYGWARYMAHQAHYSLLRREYEWELMPLALDQKVSTLVWGPLSQGRLSGKYRRDQPVPEGTRVSQGAGEGPAIPEDWFYSIVDVLDAISGETGKTVAQVSLNWLLQRPTVASVIIGARDEQQLRENLGAVGWNLTAEQVARLDAVTQTDTIYPYWHQRGFTDRNPLATRLYK
jgi:aryl-alcohol dehydrogenase-like predicted oxidoreductase